ncbi:uncharacterized protein N7506_000987 [Penicillium brevicompactum]|uniref:uncharacterized protein n=1 Tax=Penicillium brevicompactum TaxID=5074 RepID=UPI00253FBB4C|nr:uncharacterized protein N7506_000987 [Penicillium brevicompactum]KAJ5347734.1 hypothetical protein N7506_000987 [Penicillium brevicompactum]
MTVLVGEAILPDNALKSILPVFQQCETASDDAPPTKRRKVVKAGQWSLSQENGVTDTGIPLGYIPLARLTLRIKIPDTLLHHYHSLKKDSRFPVLVTANSGLQQMGGKSSCMQLELFDYEKKQLLSYSCHDAALFDLIRQIELASKLTPAERASKRDPIACYQAHLHAFPESEYLNLEVVTLWADSPESPDVKSMQDSVLEAFTEYVLQEGSRLSSIPAQSNRREAMMGVYREWSPREFYDSVHVPQTPDTTAAGLKCPGVDCELFPFQKRAVRWLLQREGKDIQQDGQLIPMKSEADGLPASFHCREDADGKTYYFSQLFMTLIRDTSAWFDAAHHLRGGILAEEMGLGKTVEVIALICLNRRAATPKVDPEGPKASGATLIITPPAILEQWKQELNRHAPSLSVHHYTGIKRNVPTRRGQEAADDDMLMNELAEFDVVLTTYNVISKEIHYAGAAPERNLRHEKRFEQRKTPLVRISWWRVCLDEAQMVESGVSNAAQVARLIPRENAWAVTGTPLRKNIDDLFGLLLFLQYRPYCFSNPLWKRLHSRFGSVLVEIIGTIALRHSKDLVRDELRLPPQKRVVITTPFTAVEEQQYGQLFDEMALDCGLDNMGAPLRGDWDPSDPKTVEKMRHWLTRLRQICLHPESGGGKRRVVGGGALRTVEEVLDTMIETNDANIRAEERTILLSQLRRGQLLENAKRRQEALALWQKALDRSTELVKISREQLRLSKERAGNEADSLVEDEEADKNSLLGQCRLKLRAALEVQHIAVFFTANAFYQIKSDTNLTTPDSDEFKELQKREEDAYEAAKAIRKEILTDVSQKVERHMKTVKEKASKNTLVKLPKMDPQIYSGGIEAYNVISNFEDLCDALNKHAEQYKEWREIMIRLVTQPLIDQEEEAELEGDEYERSTKHQDEMYVYMEALRSIYADRHDALTGDKNILISHEVKAGIAQAKKGEGPSPPLFLDIMDIRNAIQPDPELGSFRKIISELRSILTTLEWQASTGNSRARAEHEIVEMVLKNAGQMISDQLKASNGMEREVEMFRDAMNNRLEYYRQLQQISDTVAPYDEESAGMPLNDTLFADKVANEGLIEGRLSTLKSKARYLLHLKEDSSADDSARICIICQSSFEDEDSHAKPNATGHSQNAIYSDISSGLMSEIKNVELKDSFGTKIDTLARHIIWLRAHDPGAKSIVFSQYRSFVEVLQTAFARFDIGSTTVDHKNGIEMFKTDPRIECFLLHGKAQSSGLTLINATHVFLCEPLINTAIELQAIARVHRIGQHRPTTVWMYLVSGTVEESIYELSVTRRLAHIIEKEKRENAPRAHTGAVVQDLTETAIDSANSMEIQDSRLGSLMQSDGELVKKDDLWQCLFGNIKQGDGNDRSTDVEREVGRFLRGEAAQQRTSGH